MKRKRHFCKETNNFWSVRSESSQKKKQITRTLFKVETDLWYTIHTKNKKEIKQIAKVNTRWKKGGGAWKKEVCMWMRARARLWNMCQEVCPQGRGGPRKQRNQNDRHRRNCRGIIFERKGKRLNFFFTIHSCSFSVLKLTSWKYSVGKPRETF